MISGPHEKGLDPLEEGGKPNGANLERKGLICAARVSALTIGWAAKIRPRRVDGRRVSVKRLPRNFRVVIQGLT